jgi:hypothetical protein
MSENASMVVLCLFLVGVSWAGIPLCLRTMHGIARWSDERTGTRLVSGGGWLLRSIWRFILGALAIGALCGGIFAAQNTGYAWLAFGVLALLYYWSHFREAVRTADATPAYVPLPDRRDIEDARIAAISEVRVAAADEPATDDYVMWTREIEAADRAEDALRGRAYTPTNEHDKTGFKPFPEWQADKRIRDARVSELKNRGGSWQTAGKLNRDAWR